MSEHEDLHGDVPSDATHGFVREPCDLHPKACIERDSGFLHGSGFQHVGGDHDEDVPTDFLQKYVDGEWSLDDSFLGFLDNNLQQFGISSSQ